MCTLYIHTYILYVHMHICMDIGVRVCGGVEYTAVQGGETLFISGDTFHSSEPSLASCGQLEKTDKHDELAGLWPPPNAAGAGSGMEADSHSTGYGADLLHCLCAPAPVLLHMVSTVQSKGSPRQRMREPWCGFKPSGHCVSRPSALLAHGERHLQ